MRGMRRARVGPAAPDGHVPEQRQQADGRHLRVKLHAAAQFPHLPVEQVPVLERAAQAEEERCGRGAQQRRALAPAEQPGQEGRGQRGQQPHFIYRQQVVNAPAQHAAQQRHQQPFDDVRQPAAEPERDGQQQQ